MPTRRAPGPRPDRRSVLALPALAGLGLPGFARARPDEDAPGGTLAFDAFAARCEELAAAHLATRAASGGRGDDALLHALAALGARLEPGSVPAGEPTRFGSFDPPVETAPVHLAPPLVVIRWRLAPGALLPAHGHTPGLVLSLCLEGTCRVRHFEVVGDAPAPGAAGAFRVRETARRRLRPGLATSLSPSRDDVHEFRAGPLGAAGIDVNVFLPEPGDWSLLELGDEGAGADGFELVRPARWTGKP